MQTLLVDFKRKRESRPPEKKAETRMREGGRRGLGTADRKLSSLRKIECDEVRRRGSSIT